MKNRALIVEYVVAANPRKEPRLKELKYGLKVTVELTEEELWELLQLGLDRQTEERA